MPEPTTTPTSYLLSSLITILASLSLFGGDQRQHLRAIHAPHFAPAEFTRQIQAFDFAGDPILDQVGIERG